MALTKHKEGSLRELWLISAPIMVSTLSVMMMVFVDRLMLGSYSIDALNATVCASTFAWALIVGWQVLACTSEVFVAHDNGAGHYKNFGASVWQMLWVSLASSLFFIPLAIWGGSFLFSKSDHSSLLNDYFRWMVLFGPAYPLNAAVCGFFIGQGKIKLITWLAVIGNIINIILDRFFIFGYGAWIPEMGIKGAAIATNIGTFFQFFVLFTIFLKRKNRKKYGTGHYQFNPSLMWQCLQLGLPTSVFVVIEIFGWAYFYQMIELNGKESLTVASICQCIWAIFNFFAMGVHKGVITITGNFIGAGKRHLIGDTIISGCKLHGYFLCAMLLFFYFISDSIVHVVMNSPDPPAAIPNWTIKIAMLFVILHLFFDGLRMLLSGVLTASGDTLFLMVVGSISVWVFLVIPVYFVAVKLQAPIYYAVFFHIVYSIGAGVIYSWRYLQGEWRKFGLVNVS